MAGRMSWLSGRRGDGEIEMVVVAATGVEGGVAVGAGGVGMEVGGDGELGVAGSARMLAFAIRGGSVSASK
jgi:hypothetical protein